MVSIVTVLMACWQTPQHPKFLACSSGNGCKLVTDLSTPSDAHTGCSKYGTKTDQGKTITADYVDQLLNEEAEKAKKTLSAKHVDLAKNYMSQQIRAKWASDFLTVCHDLALEERV